MDGDVRATIQDFENLPEDAPLADLCMRLAGDRQCVWDSSLAAATRSAAS